MADLKINIPPRFKNKLNGTDWEIIVGTTVINAEPFLQGEPKFFPEYTIHGIDHINHVLKIADNLIPKAILDDENLYSAGDVGVLICAIIIHDLGMFIDISKFTSVLTDKRILVDGFQSDKPYSFLWNDYCQKAKRKTEYEWLNLIGKPHQKLPSVSDYGEWTERDRMIIGEFLRWYHPRLAHEIALYGFMGSEILSAKLKQRQKNLIGVIARSHGMDIRSYEIESFIQSQFGSSDYIDNCPIYYIMALLRLSDFLDTVVERAPLALSNVHAFLSPTSRKEWILNQNFKFEAFGWRNAQETRTLDMPATPKNTTEFVSAEKLLINIQREFDSSVAVVEELYRGKYEFTVGRVTSNILKTKSRIEFAEKFSLYDTRLSASSDILPLLVGPLYSNCPTFGVRELIQNAVDACNERLALDKKYKGYIEITIDTKNGLFTITDNGIGMNEDIVRNYFLCAGSSYRNSENWSDKYIDTKGKTTITRSGRFGIGALAIFLIGYQATILTRHYDDCFGLNFSYTLDAEKSIDVTRDSTIERGTKIIINMSDYANHYFSNDENANEWNHWYCLEQPAVHITLNNDVVTNQHLLPSKYNNEEGWFNFRSKIYNRFYWSYRCVNPTTEMHLTKELICNGFPIDRVEFPYHSNKDQWNNTHWSIVRGYGFDMHLPLISIVDNDCKLKLDLSRRRIESFPLEDNFIRELYKYLLAELLCGTYFTQKDYPRGCTVWESEHGYIPIAHSEKGYTILARSFILNTGGNIWCYIGERNTFDVKIPLGYMLASDFHSSTDSIHYNTDISITGKTFINGDLLVDRSYFTKCCGGVVMKSASNKSVPEILSLMPIFAPAAEILISATNKAGNGLVSLEDIYKQESFKDIYLSKSDYINTDELDIELMLDLACKLNDYNSMFLQYMPTPINDGEKNLMLEILQKYIPSDRNGGWIPYDFEERKALYPEAFRELEHYIKSILESKSFCL